MIPCCGVIKQPAHHLKQPQIMLWQRKTHREFVREIVFFLHDDKHKNTRENRASVFTYSRKVDAWVYSMMSQNAMRRMCRLYVFWRVYDSLRSTCFLPRQKRE